MCASSMCASNVVWQSVVAAVLAFRRDGERPGRCGGCRCPNRAGYISLQPYLPLLSYLAALLLYLLLHYMLLPVKLPPQVSTAGEVVYAFDRDFVGKSRLMGLADAAATIYQIWHAR
mgnify:CR=1 FL=1